MKAVQSSDANKLVCSRLCVNLWGIVRQNGHRLPTYWLSYSREGAQLLLAMCGLDPGCGPGVSVP